MVGFFQKIFKGAKNGANIENPVLKDAAPSALPNLLPKGWGGASKFHN